MDDKPKNICDLKIEDELFEDFILNIWSEITVLLNIREPSTALLSQTHISILSFPAVIPYPHTTPTLKIIASIILKSRWISYINCSPLLGSDCILKHLAQVTSSLPVI